MQGERTIRVAQIVREAIADALARGEIKDPRVLAGGLLTFSHVSVSRDLRHAKLYVLSTGGDLTQAVAGLQAASGYLRKIVAEELRAKAVPELHFFADEQFERQQKMEGLLAEISREDQSRKTEGDE